MIWWRPFSCRCVGRTANSALGLAGLGFGLALIGGARPVRAAFEVRPSAEFPSPLLPSHLPAALALRPSYSPTVGTAWSVAALHLMLEPAAGLCLDAAGLRVDRRQWAGRIGMTRLGLPGYTEWEADIGAASMAGLALDVSLFRTQPSDLLRLAAGIEPRGAASLGASFVRSVGPRMIAAIWVRDLAGMGDHRALGIERRAGGRLECAPGAGWTVSLLREWGGGRSRPQTRLALAWQPFDAWRLEHTVGPGSGGESTTMQAELGGLECLVWSGRLAAGIPAVSGFAVGRQAKARASDTSIAQPDREPSVAPTVPARCPSPPTSWQDWERAPGEDHLIIDGAAVPAGFEADSLGAWIDSLEDGASSYGGGDDADLDAADHASSLSMPSGAADSAGSNRLGVLPGDIRPIRLVPWSRLGGEDLPAVDGIDAAARGRFLAAVRSDGPRALADAIAVTPDPIVRRLLLETAPYASAQAPPSPYRAIRSIPRPAVRWSREIRSSGGGTVRASDRWEVHAAPAGRGIHASGRRPAGTALRNGSWTALIEAPGARLVLGRGSPPLTWGTGLWLRSRTVEVRTAGSVGGGRSNAVGASSPAPMESPRTRTEISSRGSALAPSSSGKDRFVAAEALLESGATRLVAMESRGRTWIAYERLGAGWSGGLLAGFGRGRTRFGVVASTVGPGGTHQAELGIEERGLWRVALRNAGAVSRAGPGRAWWDLEARTSIRRASSSTIGVTGGERTSPDHRLRLRGTIAVGSFQVGATFEAWEDGVGPAVIDALRTGRSLQLRTVVRPSSRTSLTLRGTGSGGRTVRENDGAKHTRSTQRLRLHTTAERDGRPGLHRGAAAWFLDAGYDRRATRAAPSSGAGRSVRDGRWLGLAARIRLPGKGEVSVGVLDVCPPTSGTLLVTPGWGGGAGFSASRGGLWGAGRLQWRLAWLRLEGRGSWPLLLSRDRILVAHPAWVLTCGVEA